MMPAKVTTLDHLRQAGESLLHKDTEKVQSIKTPERRNSEELFLSCVQDWAIMSSESSEASEDEDATAQKLMKISDSSEGDKISPTSVCNVPDESLHLRRVEPLDLTQTPRKIGNYSPRSRKKLLQKYMAKRKKRLSKKTVRYRVRKTLANARPRVKGRFVKTGAPLTAAVVEAQRKANPTTKSVGPVMYVKAGDIKQT